MSTNNDGGPAFPTPIDARSRDFAPVSVGMSRRDYFAGQASVGLIAMAGTVRGKADKSPTDIAIVAYEVADALLNEGRRHVNSAEVVRLKAQLAEANRKIEDYEAMRPHWAKGYSSDSIAAQSATSALSTLWKMLGVPHQTAAVQRLRELVAGKPGQ